jgi:hypothetical protein
MNYCIRGYIMDDTTDKKYEMKYTTDKKYEVGTVSVAVVMPFEIKERLDEIAEASRISRNKLIVSAIVTMLKQYGKE